MKREIISCGELLIEKGFTIAFAESATGGRLSAEFALVADAGKFLKGGLVCYDASLKESLLEVSQDLVKRYTPESAEVTEAITKGLAKLIEADLHVGVTGLVCPGGSESEEKPVGTIFIHALLSGKTLFSERSFFLGTPEEIVMAATQQAARFLVSYLTNSRSV